MLRFVSTKAVGLIQIYPSFGHSKDLITILEYGLVGEYHELFCDVSEYVFDQFLGILSPYVLC